MGLLLLNIKWSVGSKSIVNSVLVSPRHCEDYFFDDYCVLLIGKYSNVIEVFVDVDKNPGSSNEDWNEDLTVGSAISSCAGVRNGVFCKPACW